MSEPLPDYIARLLWQVDPGRLLVVGGRGRDRTRAGRRTSVVGSAVTSGITDRQLAALQELAPWLSEDTYLAGGVAVAARYGHRLSRDLGLFCPALDTEATISRLTESGLNVEIVSRAEQTAYLEPNRSPALASDRLHGTGLGEEAR